MLLAEARGTIDNRDVLEHFKHSVQSQFEAALWMLDNCMTACPADHWSGPRSIIGAYEFWLVAYHTLYCTDLYLSPSEQAFALHPEFHPGGMSDIEDEYPSRQMHKDELIRYTRHCVEKLRTVMAAESAISLEGPSGHPRRTFSRGELYLYNLRHVMHHVGMLSAHLRRAGLKESPQLRWGHAGWV